MTKFSLESYDLPKPKVYLTELCHKFYANLLAWCLIQYNLNCFFDFEATLTFNLKIELTTVSSYFSKESNCLRMLELIQLTALDFFDSITLTNKRLCVA